MFLRTAFSFTTVLDGRKTGKTVREDVFKQHDQEYGMKKLYWKEELKRKSAGDRFADPSNVKLMDRQRGRRPFIMESLVKYGKVLQSEKKAKLKQWKDSHVRKADPQLLEPLREVEALINRLKNSGKKECVALLEEDYQRIKTHVEEVYREHQEQFRQTRQSDCVSFTSLPIQRRQDILRKLSQKFHSEPSKFNIMTRVMSDRIKASYAYAYDSSNGKATRFPWNVAFRVLCSIKCGDEVKPVHKKFYDHMVIKLPKRRQKNYI